MPWRIACCAVGGWKAPAWRTSGTCAPSPKAQTPSRPGTCSVAIDDELAAAVVRAREIAQQRAGLIPGGPDQCARRNPGVVVERHAVRIGRGHALAEHELNAAALQLAAGVVPQIAAELRDDAVARMHQHEPRLTATDAGVVAAHAAHEVEQLGDRLGAREPAPGHDEGQQRPARRPVARLLRGLQRRDDVIAQAGRVLKGLEGEGMLGQPRQPVERRHGPDRHDQMVVGQLLGPVRADRERRDALGIGVHRLDVGVSEARVRAGDTDGR